MVIASGQVLGYNNPDINETLQISSGVVTVSGPGKKIIQAETGTTDDLVQIAGIKEGDNIQLFAYSGHTISMVTGSFLKLQYDFDITEYKKIDLQAFSSTIMVESSRADNVDPWEALDDWLAVVSHGGYCDPASSLAQRVMLASTQGLIQSI